MWYVYNEGRTLAIPMYSCDPPNIQLLAAVFACDFDPGYGDFTHVHDEFKKQHQREQWTDGGGGSRIPSFLPAAAEYVSDSSYITLVT